MHPEAARERLDRREQPLLQPDDEQPGGGPHPAGRGGVTLLAGRAVLVEQTRQGKLRRVGRQAADRQPHDVALREPALDLAHVLLQAPHHHVLERAPPPHLDPAREAVGV